MVERKEYDYGDLKPEDAYYESWKEFHRSVQFCTAGLIISVASVPMAILAAAAISGSRADKIEFASLVLVLIFVVGCVLGLIGTKISIKSKGCPRCGTHQIVSNLMLGGLPFCDGCSLPKYAPNNPDKQKPGSH